MTCICTHLISTASPVSLVPRPEDRTRLLISSLRSFSGPAQLSICTGMLGGTWERGYISLARLPQQLHEQHALLSLLSWAYSAYVCFLLCCFNSAARCHIQFYASLSGSSVVCGVLRGSLQEHDCAISTIPKASLRKLLYQLPFRFTLGTWL